MHTLYALANAIATKTVSAPQGSTPPDAVASPCDNPVDPIPSSRQYPNESGSIRPLTATQNATRDCVVVATRDDPDLAAVVAAWPDLSKAIAPVSW